MKTDVEAPHATERLSLPELTRELASDGLALARAEFVLARIWVAPKIASATLALGLIACAAVIAFLGAIALVMGVVIALVLPLGPILAGLAVGGPAVTIAGILGWVGLRRMSALLKPLLEKLP